MPERESFIFYRSFYEALIGMDKESQADCLMSLANYALNGEERDLKPEVKMFFTLVKPQIDANQKRFENGCKGGRPKKPNNSQEETKIKPNRNQTETKPEPNVNVNDNYNSNNKKENYIKEKRFGELKNVMLTQEQFDKLSAEHNNLNEAIEKLDTWLGTSGRKNKNRNHYAYFKSNSWVWENLKETGQKQEPEVFIDEKIRIDENMPEFNDMTFEECEKAHRWLNEKMYCQSLPRNKFIEIVRKFKNN